MKRCADCDEICHEDNLFYCEHCDEDYCDDCIVRCDLCFDMVCRSCVTVIENEKCCPDCVERIKDENQ